VYVCALSQPATCIEVRVVVKIVRRHFLILIIAEYSLRL